MSFSEQMLAALEQGDQAQARELFTQALKTMTMKRCTTWQVNFTR